MSKQDVCDKPISMYKILKSYFQYFWVCLFCLTKESKFSIHAILCPLICIPLHSNPLKCFTNRIILMEKNFTARTLLIEKNLF